MKKIIVLSLLLSCKAFADDPAPVILDPVLSFYPEFPSDNASPNAKVLVAPLAADEHWEIKCQCGKNIIGIDRIVGGRSENKRTIQEHSISFTCKKCKHVVSYNYETIQKKPVLIRVKNHPVKAVKSPKLVSN